MCPVAYRDLDAAPEHLGTAFGFEIVRVNGGAEVRWYGGVVVAQTERPDELQRPHVGTGWTYVQVDDPDEHHERSVRARVQGVNEPHSTPDGRQRGYSARDIEGNPWTFGIAPSGVDP